jgi:MFS family permease
VLTVSFGLGIAAGQILAGSVVGYGFFVPFLVGALLALVGATIVHSEVVERPRPMTAPT